MAVIPFPGGDGSVPPPGTVDGSYHVVPLILERYPKIFIVN